MYGNNMCLSYENIAEVKVSRLVIQSHIKNNLIKGRLRLD